MGHGCGGPREGAEGGVGHASELPTPRSSFHHEGGMKLVVLDSWRACGQSLPHGRFYRL